MKNIDIKQNRGIGDRFPAVFEYFFANIKGLLVPYLIYAGPILLLITGYSAYLTNTYFVEIFENMDPDDPSDILKEMMDAGFSYGSMSTIFLLGLLSSLLVLGIFGAFIRLREERGEVPEAAEVFRHALPKMVPLLVLLFLTYIATMAGLFVVCIGAIIVLVFFSVAYPAIFMEDLNGVEAIGRSFNLVKSQFFDTLLYFVILVLVVVFTIFIAGLGLNLISSFGMAVMESSKILGVLIMGLVGLINQFINGLIYVGQFMHYGHLVSNEDNSFESQVNAL